MIIFPAIDLIGGKAVRLYKGDYDKKTEYGEPEKFAIDFKKCGATHIHVVDLDGAKSGLTFNFDAVESIKRAGGVFVEVGGGIRDVKTAEKYLGIVDRVILGTAAVKDKGFLTESVRAFGDRIAVGADVKDGYIAINGWTESSGLKLFDFLDDVIKIGVKTVICTDVGKDGAMKGTNLSLYEKVSEKFPVDLIASGGVSDIGDVTRLKEIGVYGAIIGKAYYAGKIDLKTAIQVAK